MVAAKLRLVGEVADSVPDRNVEWNFDGSVRAAFTFLDDRGFSVAETRSGHVLFESSTVQLSVFRDRLEYDLGLTIALRDATQSISLDELQIICGQPPIDILRPQSRSEMREDTAKIAGIVENTNPGILSGSLEAWRVAEARVVKWRQLLQSFYAQRQIVPKLASQTVAEWATIRRSERLPVIAEFNRFLQRTEPFPFPTP